MTLIWRCSRHVIQALVVVICVAAQDHQSELGSPGEFVPVFSSCDPREDGLHSSCGSFKHNIVPSATSPAVGPTRTESVQDHLLPSDNAESLQTSIHRHADDTSLAVHPVYAPTPSLTPTAVVSTPDGPPTAVTPEVTSHAEKLQLLSELFHQEPGRTSQPFSDVTSIATDPLPSDVVVDGTPSASLLFDFAPTPTLDGAKSPATPSVGKGREGPRPTPNRTSDLLPPPTAPQEPPKTKAYRVTMVVTSDCSDDEEVGLALDSVFRKFPGEPHVQVANSSCQREMTVVLSVWVAEGQVEAFVREVGLWGSAGNQSVLVVDKVFRVISARAWPESGNSSEVTGSLMTTEMIVYIAVGASFGVVLLVALVICCVKCCRRKPSKMLEMEAIPHVNFCPDDYTLTRIPRPNTICLDYYRGSLLSDHFAPTPSGTEQGIVQPFDTSIVPLEDSRPPNARQNGPGYHLVASPRQMKTFNGKMQRDGSFVEDPSITDSTERLHRELSRDKSGSGVDNVSFAKF